MTTHLSARLAWHDRGWDGRVCDAPHLNAHCIAHEHIRNARDDDKERRFAGAALSELDGWLPPCSRDPAAYAARGFRIVHHDPLETRQLPPGVGRPASVLLLSHAVSLDAGGVLPGRVRGGGSDDPRSRGSPDQRLGPRARPPAGTPQAVLGEAGAPRFPHLLLLQIRPARREHAPHHRRRGQDCGSGSATLLRDDAEAPRSVPRLVSAHQPNLPRPRGFGSRIKSTCATVIRRRASSVGYPGMPCCPSPTGENMFPMTLPSPSSNASSNASSGSPLTGTSPVTGNSVSSG